MIKRGTITQKMQKIHKDSQICDWRVKGSRSGSSWNKNLACSLKIDLCRHISALASSGTQLSSCLCCCNSWLTTAIAAYNCSSFKVRASVFGYIKYSLLRASFSCKSVSCFSKSAMMDLRVSTCFYASARFWLSSWDYFSWRLLTPCKKSVPWPSV